jgi:NAD+--asparagine ADP-ribosyltransferase
MKTKGIILSALLLLSFASAKSQNTGIYQLNARQLEITDISFKIFLPNYYSKTIKKELTGITFNKYRKQGKYLCYVKKNYSTDKEEGRNTSLGEEIDVQVYDTIVKKLNALNLEDINYDANITDGSSYFLSFGGGSININLSAHTAGGDNASYPELKDFLDLFDYVFKIVE